MGEKKKRKKKSFAYKINNLIYENKHFKKAISILSEQWEENKLYTVSW